MKYEKPDVDIILSEDGIVTEDAVGTSYLDPDPSGGNEDCILDLTQN